MEALTPGCLAMLIECEEVADLVMVCDRFNEVAHWVASPHCERQFVARDENLVVTTQDEIAQRARAAADRKTYLEQAARLH